MTMIIIKKIAFLLLFPFLAAAVAEPLQSSGGDDAAEVPCQPADSLPEAPVAEKQPHVLTAHNDTRVDNYYWMRLSDDQKNSKTPDAQTEQVLNYLHAENNYTAAVLSHTAHLQEQLFQEMTGRIKQDDKSVPIKSRGYWYYSRVEEGKEYSINCRKLAGDETLYEDCTAPEEILLNQNELAAGHDYFRARTGSVSDDNTLLAFAVDTVGRRQYTIKVKNLVTGEMLRDEIPGTSGSITWAADNRTFFYVKNDPDTLRAYRVYRHVLSRNTDENTSPLQQQQQEEEEDTLVFEETDETFELSIYRTKSRKYVMIWSWQALEQEFRALPADDPVTGEWHIIQPRERGLEYEIYHGHDDYWYIVTNKDNATNFKIMKTSALPGSDTSKENWVDVIPHRPDVLLSSMEIFKDYLVLQERVEGLNQIRVMSWENETKDEYLQFVDEAFNVGVGTNRDYDTEILRFSYTSMTTPGSTYEQNMRTGERVLLKQREVVDDNFSPDHYASQRFMVTARDGVKVPVSMVYRKGMITNNGQNPFLLYGYGSYGSSMNPYFSYSRLSLLDRGFIFALAHIRGGQELGRSWYEDGKLLNKQNTFNDFEDVGRAMVELKYTSPEHLYAAGGSAGGLLMGAVMNQAPNLFHGVLASVPFVDVVTTMLDDTIPLTTFEWDEWGNPANEEYYWYMKSYSPYDQVHEQAYPNTLVRSGYWDSQVQYWEPTKWVAKLRAHDTGENLILLHTNMDAGHGGNSGRFNQYREIAMEYAFLLDLEGMCVTTTTKTTTTNDDEEVLDTNGDSTMVDTRSDTTTSRAVSISSFPDNTVVAPAYMIVSIFGLITSLLVL